MLFTCATSTIGTLKNVGRKVGVFCQKQNIKEKITIASMKNNEKRN